MERYLIDTNAVSKYLCESLSEYSMSFMDEVIDSIPNLSVISQIELLSWNTDLFTTQKIKDFIEDSKIYELSADVVQICVELRKDYKLKTPDAIIAATAILHDFTLITHNTRDFGLISNLKLMDVQAV